MNAHRTRISHLDDLGLGDLTEDDGIGVDLVPSCPADHKTLTELAREVEIEYDPDNCSSIQKDIAEAAGVEYQEALIRIYGGDCVRDGLRRNTWLSFRVSVYP